MKMKRTFSIAICLCMAVSMFLSGCSKKEDASSSESSAAAKTYTLEEAKAINSKINASDVKLIQFENPESGSEIATISTSMGDIKVMFFPGEASKAVENFITHAKEGYYDGLKFHRVQEDFMIQGGDPKGSGSGGQSIYTDEEGNAIPFEDEFSLNLWNFNGALAMANSGPDTNKSQFYIVQAGANTLNDEYLQEMTDMGFPAKVVDMYKLVGGAPWLDHQNTVFGQVIEGMDVVNAIAAVEANSDGKPKEDVLINSITFASSDGVTVTAPEASAEEGTGADEEAPAA